MAERIAWKGTITLGLVSIKVEAMKGTDKYAGDEPLKDLCACHDKPLDRSHRCAETMQAPSGKVKGVEKPDGSMAILTDAQVQSIKAGIDSGDIEPLAYEAQSAWASHTVSELWNLQPNHKEAGAEEAVNALYATLAEHDKVLLARIVKDGRQHIIVIAPVDGVLRAMRVRYTQELREPNEAARAVGKAEVAPKAVEMLDSILTELPGGFDIAQVEDVTVGRKQAAIQAALAGKEVAPTEVAAEAPSAVPDLMATLTAAVEAKGKKPTRKKPTAKEAVKT